ncbi:hypothetical protein [Roseivirga sp. E12]|uniref:hypothetical protein n=1 Tax=Roseivirga sp. E12 TaxID=2819237 RepID=UPI001ABC5A9C|nr:hypothetical protein [Roseivirga sp. E12]
MPMSEDPTSLEVFFEGTEEFIADHSTAISTLKFGDTFKTTSAGRHSEANNFVKQYLKDTSKRADILDLGASNGVTSLDLIELLGDCLDRYYVTDLNLKVWMTRHENWLIFFDSFNKPILKASKYFVVYNDPMDSSSFITSRIRKTFESINSRNLTKEEILLIDPRLEKLSRSNDKISFSEHNIFDFWDKSTPNVVKVSNILNRAYFSDDLIKSAIQQIKNYVEDGALIVFSRNDAAMEKVSTFIKKGKSLIAHESLNGGVEIVDLID